MSGRLSLPGQLESEPKAAPSTLPMPENNSASSTTLSVLVVDSSATGRKHSSRLLKECDYLVQTVHNRKAALEFLLSPKGASIDVVLKEHEPPKSDAAHFLSSLARSGVNTPVIVMSSQNDPEEVIKCVTKGALDYLVKPLRQNELRLIWTRVWFWRNRGFSLCQLDAHKQEGAENAASQDKSTTVKSVGADGTSCGKQEGAWDAAPKDGSSEDDVRGNVGSSGDRSKEDGSGNDTRDNFGCGGSGQSVEPGCKDGNDESGIRENSLPLRTRERGVRGSAENKTTSESVATQVGCQSNETPPRAAQDASGPVCASEDKSTVHALRPYATHAAFHKRYFSRLGVKLSKSVQAPGVNSARKSVEAPFEDAAYEADRPSSQSKPVPSQGSRPEELTSKISNKRHYEQSKEQQGPSPPHIKSLLEMGVTNVQPTNSNNRHGEQSEEQQGPSPPHIKSLLEMGVTNVQPMHSQTKVQLVNSNKRHHEQSEEQQGPSPPHIKSSLEMGVTKVQPMNNQNKVQLVNSNGPSPPHIKSLLEMGVIKVQPMNSQTKVQPMNSQTKVQVMNSQSNVQPMNSVTKVWPMASPIKTVAIAALPSAKSMDPPNEGAVKLREGVSQGNSGAKGSAIGTTAQGTCHQTSGAGLFKRPSGAGAQSSGPGADQPAEGLGPTHGSGHATLGSSLGPTHGLGHATKGSSLGPTHSSSFGSTPGSHHNMQSLPAAVQLESMSNMESPSPSPAPSHHTAPVHPPPAFPLAPQPTTSSAQPPLWLMNQNLMSGSQMHPLGVPQLAPPLPLNSMQGMPQLVPSLHLNTMQGMPQLAPPLPLNAMQGMPQLAPPLALNAMQGMPQLAPPLALNAMQGMPQLAPPLALNAMQGMPQLAPPLALNAMQGMPQLAPPLHLNSMQGLPQLTPPLPLNAMQGMPQLAPPLPLNAMQGVPPLLPLNTMQGMLQLAPPHPLNAMQGVPPLAPQLLLNAMHAYSAQLQQQQQMLAMQMADVALHYQQQQQQAAAARALATQELLIQQQLQGLGQGPRLSAPSWHQQVAQGGTSSPAASGGAHLPGGGAMPSELNQKQIDYIPGIGVMSSQYNQEHSDQAMTIQASPLGNWSKAAEGSQELKRKLRADAMARWKEKKKTLTHMHTLRYENRKRCADTRPRVNGWFVCSKLAAADDSEATKEI